MNPSEVLVDPIEIKYNNNSDSVSTDSTESLLPGSSRIECSKDFRKMFDFIIFYTVKEES